MGYVLYTVGDGNNYVFLEYYHIIKGAIIKQGCACTWQNIVFDAPPAAMFDPR